jgi:hypothetical protein
LIPEGYKRRLHPMDVVENKLFMRYIGDNFTDWLIGSRNKKKARQDLVG